MKFKYRIFANSFCFFGSWSAASIQGRKLLIYWFFVTIHTYCYNEKKGKINRYSLFHATWIKQIEFLSAPTRKSCSNKSSILQFESLILLIFLWQLFKWGNYSRVETIRGNKVIKQFSLNVHPEIHILNGL